MNPLKAARTHLFPVHRTTRCVSRGCFPCIYCFSVNLALNGETCEPTTSTGDRGLLPQPLSHLSSDPPVKDEKVPCTMLGASSISYCLQAPIFCRSQQICFCTSTVSNTAKFKHPKSHNLGLCNLAPNLWLLLTSDNFDPKQQS